jgi:Flp pilus assembly pilin Flp
MKKLISFLKDEEGAAGVEYGIMVAAVAAMIVAIAFAVGVKTQNGFTTVDGVMGTNGM